MIAVLKPNVSQEQKTHLIAWLKSQGLDVHISEGKDYTVLGLVGDTSRVDPDLLASLPLEALGAVEVRTRSGSPDA